MNEKWSKMLKEKREELVKYINDYYLASFERPSLYYSIWIHDSGAYYCMEEASESARPTETLDGTVICIWKEHLGQDVLQLAVETWDITSDALDAMTDDERDDLRQEYINESCSLFDAAQIIDDLIDSYDVD